MGNCLAARVPGTSKESGHFGNNEVSSSTSTRLDEVHPDGHILESPKLKVFTLAELKSATRNFRPDQIIGEGGFGRVFKGSIDENTYAPSNPGKGIAVAVKRMNLEGMQGLEEGLEQPEVNIFGSLSHPNLVTLIGYCSEDKEFFVVYEFMKRGSLEINLFSRGSAVQPLSWSIRIKIALGAARGLAFLHASPKQIIYRDVKPSNILLDEHFNAKLSSSGLATNGPSSADSHVSEEVMGTFGYAAPEYVATGYLYVNSDVYGFGVVLLELLTGLRAFDASRPSGQRNLVDWAKPSLFDPKKLKRIMDPRLEAHFPVKGALKAAQLALKCLGYDPRKRPSMKEAVETLENIQLIKEKPKESNVRTKCLTGHHESQNNVGH